MDFVYAKNDISNLLVYFYKKNVLDSPIIPAISLIKIDSATKTMPVNHLGSRNNMGYLYGKKVITGVLVFEVLEGYPLESMMHSSNASLEDLPPLDFYCIQKDGLDPSGDFKLTNLKFIDSRSTQSTSEFSRKIVSTFVCEKKLRINYDFMNVNLKKDNYSEVYIYTQQDKSDLLKDIDVYADQISDFNYRICCNILNVAPSNDKASQLKARINKLVEPITYSILSAKKDEFFDDNINTIKDFINAFYNGIKEINRKGVQ